jgi:hypothetical protein
MDTEQFYKESFDYSVAKLRVVVYIDTILELGKIENPHERYRKIQQVLERMAYEAYAFGADAAQQDMLDKIMSINIETERLYHTGLVNDSGVAVREICEPPEG